MVMNPVAPPTDADESNPQPTPRWAWLNNLAGLRRLALATLVATLALIGLGGAVRATDSGLACPDWPFCYGEVIPMQDDIPDDSHYTLWNVWLEHSHRMVAGLVGCAIAAILGWVLVRFRHRPSLLWPAVLALVAVVVQATLGALVVLHLLSPGLVTAHLGMSMVVVACLVTIVAGSSTAHRWVRRGEARGALARPALACAILVFLQILIGGHVTGLAAGLAFGTDPLRFNGNVLPPWPDGWAEAVHIAHRGLAILVGVAVIALAVVARRQVRTAGPAAASPCHPRSPLVIGVLVMLVATQITLGVINLIRLSPPAIVSAHLTVAGLIWAASVTLVTLELLVAVPADDDAPSRHSAAATPV